MERKWSLFSVFNYIFLALVGFSMIYPFIYILAYSLNDGKDSMQGAIYFLPRQFTLDNYAQVFDNARIWKAYQITIMRTVLGTFLHVVLCTLMAYALSKKHCQVAPFSLFTSFCPRFSVRDSSRFSLRFKNCI